MTKDIKISLAWAGAIIGVSLAASAALSAGYIDNDTATRTVAMNGLMIAYFGNRMPKALAPSECARQVARVGGWAMVLSGLVYAGMFAFAPIQTAVLVGCGAVIAGMAVTFAYAIKLRNRVRAA